MSKELIALAETAASTAKRPNETDHRLERNGYTGREQFQTRFCATKAWGSVVKGLGFKTRCELEEAGFRFRLAHSTSVASHYVLDHRG